MVKVDHKERVLAGAQDSAANPKLTPLKFGWHSVVAAADKAGKRKL